MLQLRLISRAPELGPTLEGGTGRRGEPGGSVGLDVIDVSTNFIVQLLKRPNIP